MASAAERVQAAAGVLERSGGRRELTTPFMSWKSRVIQMAPLKHLDGLVQRGWGLLCQPLPSCLHPCCSWRYRRGCFVCGLDPGNQRDFKTPAAAPLNRACKRALPRGRRRRPSAEEIRDVEKLCMPYMPCLWINVRLTHRDLRLYK